MEKQLLGISLILFGILLNSCISYWMFVTIPIGLWGLIIVVKESKKSKEVKKDITEISKENENEK